MKTIFLLFLFVVLSLPCVSQDCKDSLTTFQFECNSKKTEIHVPCGFIEADFDYADGGKWEIEYADESVISIFCGAGQTTAKKKADPNLKYKKIMVGPYTVIFEDVPVQRAVIFEKAFALLEHDLDK